MKLPKSSLHSKLEPGSLEENSKVGVESLVGLEGPEVIVVSGGVVSGTVVSRTVLESAAQRPAAAAVRSADSAAGTAEADLEQQPVATPDIPPGDPEADLLADPSDYEVGADGSVAVGPAGGAGVSAGTTAGLGADIYSYAKTRGVFAGLSLDGTAIVKRDSWNTAYYGKGATPRGILIERRFSNPAADRLRQALVPK